jgi:hypothetical protein
MRWLWRFTGLDAATAGFVPISFAKNLLKK